jgi:HK97 family phage prohead protease
MEIQKRTIELPVADLHLREEGDESNGRIIEGYALKFGVRSQLINDWYERYYEVLEPGSLSRETLDSQDFILSLYHDPHRVLGRSNNGQGTLSYEVDEVGVKFWCEMPNTADGNEALELVKRGDLDGCSFIYSTNEEDNVAYSKTQDEEGRDCLLRRVIKIDNIYDFTLTWRPAYKQTECSAREREALDAIVNPKVETTEDTIEKENDREKESEEQRRREVASLRSAAASILRD